MKKLIIFIATLLFLVSCDSRPNGKVTSENVENLNFYIKEVTVRKETHEYLEYDMGYGVGLTHLPNCKYCIHNETNN